MSEMHPCSAVNHHTGSDLRLEIKQNHGSIVKKFSCIFTNLEQMFKCMATDLSTQLTTQQSSMCALKSVRLLLPQQYGQ